MIDLKSSWQACVILAAIFYKYCEVAQGWSALYKLIAKQ